MHGLYLVIVLCPKDRRKTYERGEYFILKSSCLALDRGEAMQFNVDREEKSLHLHPRQARSGSVRPLCELRQDSMAAGIEREVS